MKEPLQVQSPVRMSFDPTGILILAALVCGFLIGWKLDTERLANRGVPPAAEVKPAAMEVPLLKPMAAHPDGETGPANRGPFGQPAEAHHPHRQVQSVPDEGDLVRDQVRIQQALQERQALAEQANVFNNLLQQQAQILQEITNQHRVHRK